MQMTHRMMQENHTPTTFKARGLLRKKTKAKKGKNT
jgi:hypothetical protein